MKSTMRVFLFALILLGSLLFAAFAYLPAHAQAPGNSPAMPIGNPIQIKTPLALAAVCTTIQVSASMAPSPAPPATPRNFAFSGKRPVSEGVGKKTGDRHASTVINSAYFTLQFWDGRAPASKNKPKVPSPIPSKWHHSLDGIVKQLQSDPI
jgi:hypothetical protein